MPITIEAVKGLYPKRYASGHNKTIEYLVTVASNSGIISTGLRRVRRVQMQANGATDADILVSANTADIVVTNAEDGTYCVYVEGD